MIGYGYEDQAEAVVDQVNSLAATYNGAPKHNNTCAFYALVSSEENAAFDGLTLTDAEAIERAVRLITEDGYCQCDQA